MIYELPRLPYSTDALEPVISRRTIEYHYGKHEKTYIDNLNKLIKGTEYEDLPLEKIISHAHGAIYNNAAQAWNHIFYFFAFTPGGSPDPEGTLRNAINRDFGSLENFKKLFVEAGTNIFGSGWVWLSCDEDDKLLITQSSNADNPIVHGLTPLLVFDVWEHAYYLDYQNQRADHLNRLFDIVDWNIVESRYSR